MTNSIAFPTTRTTIADKTELLITFNLVKTISHYQIKIEKTFHQLLSISKSHQNLATRKRAEKYLQRQTKLVEITNELKHRMRELIASNNIKKEQVAQFVQEVDLLNWMHFKVAKSHASFINQNFEAQIISIAKHMAA